MMSSMLLAVYLLSECHWEFAKGASECVLRSCVCFKFPNIPVSIAFADFFSFFKVSVEAPHPMYPKVCPKIREDIPYSRLISRVQIFAN